MAKNTSVMMQASVAPQPLPPIDSVRVKTHKPLPEAERTSKIHNLTFEGGGAKGYCYIGALQVLEEEGIYPHNIQRVAGTNQRSAGTVIAAAALPPDGVQQRWDAIVA